MNIIVSIGGDSVVSMNDQDLAALNQVLANTPVVNRYDNDKVEADKRIKLEATMVVKTRSYSVLPQK